MCGFTFLVLRSCLSLCGTHYTKPADAIHASSVLEKAGITAAALWLTVPPIELSNYSTKADFMVDWDLESPPLPLD